MSFLVHPSTGLLAGARQVISPHSDARPADAGVDLIVLHGISLPPGEFGGPWIERLFCGQLPADQHPYFAEVCAMRVSAHLLIGRDGDVVQFAPFSARTWHAGASSFGGRNACNDFSIGIELEGTDDAPYSEAQYGAAAQVIRALLSAYPALSAQRLVGHSDIAPGRKTDPGAAFDWQKLRRMLAGK